MTELCNRMAMQRDILVMVNSQVNWIEELNGLASLALNRWLSINNLKQAEPVVFLLFDISRDLFSLSTKSQSSISNEYKNTSTEISQKRSLLLAALKDYRELSTN